MKIVLVIWLNVFGWTFLHAQSGHLVTPSSKAIIEFNAPANNTLVKGGLKTARIEYSKVNIQKELKPNYINNKVRWELHETNALHISCPLLKNESKSISHKIEP